MKARATAALLGLALLAVTTASGGPLSIEESLLRVEELRTSDPAQFSALLDQLNAAAATASDGQRQQLRYYNNYRLAFSGRFDQAAADLKLLFNEAQSLDLKFRVGALIANSYAATRQYVEGLRYLDQTLELLPSITRIEYRHQGLGVAAILYNQLGQFELGLNYANQIIADGASSDYYCSALHLRFEAILRLGTPQLAESEIEEAIARCSELQEPVVVGFLRLDLAQRLVADGKPALAIDLLRTRLGEAEATRYSRLIVEYHSTLAELLLAANDADSASNHALKAVELDQGSAPTLPRVIAYQVLYRVAQQRGETRQELEYYRLYAEADRAYVNEVKARELAYQLARLETLRKNQSIEILSKQNEVLRLQQQVAQQSARNNQLLLALLAVLLASLAAWAWRAKRMQVSLRRLAEYDALTGVFNRRHFTELAQQKLTAAAATGKPMCLVMFDLDHFKRINDSYGHPTGDWVLKQAASTCANNCRKNDLIGRMGGEEFAILLVGCDSDSALLLADHCREALAAIDTSESGHAFQITGSFGVASARESGYDFKTLFNHADTALYASKHGGRNRVSAYTGETGPAPAAR